jgi:cardiolipin synthase
MGKNGKRSGAMKRVIRVLGSRYFLAGVCIVLEFGLLTALFVYLYQYFLPITVLGWVLQIVVLLYLINRDDIPEFKIPWILMLLLIPVTGAFIFLVFSSNQATKKQHQRYQAATQAMEPYRGQTPDFQRLQEEDPSAALQAAYLYSAAHVPCHGDTQVTYYPLGESFYPALLEALESAEHFIFMEYFIVQTGQMWDAIHAVLRRKAADGLAVYVMYDDVGCMTTLSGHYYETLEAEGIHAIPSNRFRPIVSHIHNNRDHRKITVVDGRIGFTGGINLADRYINAQVVYGHWKDTAVRLEGPAVRNLTGMFLTAWNLQSDRPIDSAPYLEVEPPKGCAEGFVIPFGDGPAPLYKDYVGKNVYLNIIHSAQNYVYITTPYLICDQELLNALRTAAKKGVDVRLITPHIPDKKTVFLMTRSNYLPLVQDGVRIYEYTPGFIHAKNMVSDDRIAVCGTINLDYRSLVHNFECGAWIYESACAQAMRTDFLATAAVSQEITLEAATLRGIPRLVAELMKVFSTLL